MSLYVEAGDTALNWKPTLEEFIHPKNIRKKFLKEAGEEKAKLFLELVFKSNVPMDFSTELTGPEDFPDVYWEMLKKTLPKSDVVVFPKETCIVQSKQAEAGACYKVACQEALDDGTLDLYVGFCNYCSDENNYNLHAFCVSPYGTIVEHTPLTRDLYTGVLLPKEFIPEFLEYFTRYDIKQAA